MSCSYLCSNVKVRQIYIYLSYILLLSYIYRYIFIPKLVLTLLWSFRRTAALFRLIRTFPQSFRFCSDLGNSGIGQIVRNSMLTGRWWDGRILINLCGKNNVQNCDLLQSDFFARCRTALGVAKAFFGVCGENWKKMRPQNVVIFYAWETCY